MKTRLLLITLLMATLMGCSREVYIPVETVRADTVMVETHDTVKVNQRTVPVSLAVPETRLESVTTDTTDTLSNGMYRSVAGMRNGMLFHLLESLPGARLEGMAVMADTTRTADRNQTRKSDTSQKKTVTVEVERKLTLAQTVALWTGYVIWSVVLALLTGYGVYRMIKLGRRWKWL